MRSTVSIHGARSVQPRRTPRGLRCWAIVALACVVARPAATTASAAAPDNDECAAAIPLGEGARAVGTLVDAAPDGQSSCGPAGSADVWFEYTAPDAGTVTLSVAASAVPVTLSAHPGCPETTTSELACASASAGTSSSDTLPLRVAAGQHVWFRVASAGGTGEIALDAERTESAPLDAGSATDGACADCAGVEALPIADMVFVAAGTFSMGQASDQPDEEPQRTVNLDAFWIDRNDVTVDEYDACVSAGACDDPKGTHAVVPNCNWGAANRGNYPINCVDWHQADDYCQWVDMQLPTEAQWEKAARGTNARLYPWGAQEVTCSYAVMWDTYPSGVTGCGTSATATVGSKPSGVSPYGALDMSGNVYQWVNDWYDATYYQSSPSSNPPGPGIGSFKVRRGGDYATAAYTHSLRTYSRNYLEPSGFNPGLGFRCVAPRSQTLTLQRSGTGSGTVTSNPAGIDCGSTCSASFPQSGVVALTPTPNSDSKFTSWSGACSGSGACQVTMSAAKSVTATFTLLPTYKLTVTESGSGTGTVTSSPAGIDCGAACSASFPQGQVVTLTPTPSPDSKFTSWSGACTGSGACQVTMSAAKSVTATFTLLPTYKLTVTESGSGTGTVTSDPSGIDCGATCSASFPQGRVVTLTPTPSADSKFASWSGACTGSGVCQVTMSAAKSVTASFTLLPKYKLTVTESGGGTGRVTSDPAGIDCEDDCSESFPQGQVVTLTPTPSPDSKFTSWSGACTGSGACQVTMSAAKSVTAKFVLLPTYTLTVMKSGNGTGSVTSSPDGVLCGATCSADFPQNQVVTLTPTPSADSKFASWGGACGGSGACQVTMSAARSVTATFTLLPTFELAVSTAGSGSGTVISSPAGVNCGATCSANFPQGQVVTLTPVPAADSSFTSWSGACSGSGPCQVTMSAARSVTATFDVIPNLIFADGFESADLSHWSVVVGGP